LEEGVGKRRDKPKGNSLPLYYSLLSL